MKDYVLNQKKAVIEEIKTNIQNAKSTTLVGFNGMSVSEITELRNKFREKDVNYKVYKNTMIRFAFDQLGYEEADELLSGSNALVFSNEDLVEGPKIAAEFIDDDEDNKDKLKIKAGIVEGDLLNEEQIMAIAKLPPKEVLLSMLVNTVQAPIRKLAQDTNEIIAKLVYGLDAVREKKENEAA
ncbi:MAG: 50S ribosomal protein L10 [Tissierellia bacterium]|nr:50S ribosomal protein L10 [Tissierellia bacterium]